MFLYATDIPPLLGLTPSRAGATVSYTSSPAPPVCTVPSTKYHTKVLSLHSNPLTIGGYITRDVCSGEVLLSRRHVSYEISPGDTTLLNVLMWLSDSPCAIYREQDHNGRSYEEQVNYDPTWARGLLPIFGTT